MNKILHTFAKTIVNPGKIDVLRWQFTQQRQCEMQTKTKRESVLMMPNSPGKGNASNCQPTPLHAFYGDGKNSQGGVPG